MLFREKKAADIEEYQAKGEVAETYHDIAQILRVSGVNLIFRRWAAMDEGVFADLWTTVRPLLKMKIFEHTADELRRAIVKEAALLQRSLKQPHIGDLGESQAYQVRAALDTYHYVLPKLILIATVVRQGLLQSHDFRPNAIFGDEIVGGVPPRMYPMEMVDAEPKSKRLRRVFTDIQTTLGTDSINSIYRTLALWPDYLIETWKVHKEALAGPCFFAAKNRMQTQVDQLVASFPTEVDFDSFEETLTSSAKEQLFEISANFGQVLPMVALHVAVHQLLWKSVADAGRSPFPAIFRAPLSDMRGAI